MIRPSGVVSKKDMGALSTLVTASYSILLLALVAKTDSRTEKTNMHSTCSAPRPAYTPMYCALEKPKLSDVHHDNQSPVKMLTAWLMMSADRTTGTFSMEPDARM